MLGSVLKLLCIGMKPRKYWLVYVHKNAISFKPFPVNPLVFSWICVAAVDREFAKFDVLFLSVFVCHGELVLAPQPLFVGMEEFHSSSQIIEDCVVCVGTELI